MISMVWPAEWLKMKMKIKVGKSIIPQLRCLADLQTLSSAYCETFTTISMKILLVNNSESDMKLHNFRKYRFSIWLCEYLSLSCSNQCQVTALNSHCALHRLTASSPHSKESFAHRETLFWGKNASAISIIHHCSICLYYFDNIWSHQLF